MVIVAGAVLAVVSSIIGFFRPFTMTGPAMPAMNGNTLQGMPLTDMPEMFLAGAGLLVTLVGAVVLGNRARPGRGRAVPATGQRGRWLIAAVATAALTIDISKTSTLGFVIPGVRAEYGITASTASFLAVAGLSGTATGALVFTRMADHLGRRASYLIATLGFTVTSMCGTMPGFGGNVTMCFLMGIAVGGLAPLLITILADLFPGKARGPMVTGLSVVATAIGYLIASGSALWLEPAFGWRVLWLIGAPTGLVLAAATFLIPERASFAEAAPEPADDAAADRRRWESRTTFTAGLQRVYAVAVGLLTFGLTTWVPTLSRAGGLSLTTANTLLTSVAVAMVPCAVLMMLLYRRIGPVRLAVRLAVCTAALLLALAASGLAGSQVWLTAAALTATLFAVNTMAAIFLPIAADLAETRKRGRATGTVSFFNRVGGLTGPLLISLIVSSVTDVLVAVAVLALICGTIAWYTGRRHHRVTTAPAPGERMPERSG
ncbi:MFS transporter [Amycolatopsis sp. NBC_00345]|uniref:MFS transporter n=1 Tax=Amycolatopsis sp. NBC_00345 TaxID=2975955 RepID=UPI002E256A28